MAENAGLGHYPETHDHDFKAPLLVYVNSACILVLAALVIFFNHYLNDRRHVADQRNERERVAICAILEQIPSSGRPQIVAAKVAFNCE